jgi:hypothetical protein
LQFNCLRVAGDVSLRTSDGNSWVRLAHQSTDWEIQLEVSSWRKTVISANWKAFVSTEGRRMIKEDRCSSNRSVLPLTIRLRRRNWWRLTALLL